MKLEFNAQKLKEVRSKHLKIARVDSDIDVTNLFISKKGEPWYVVSGEFHYSRYDCDSWEDEILKIKAGGVNVIATYAFWNHHEYKKGKWNFEGDMNVKHFISLCQKHGMYVIFRMGPYCHGEVVYGGYPKYIYFNPKKRSNAKGYINNVKRLYSKYYDELKDYFYPNGTIIGVQIDNEFTGKYEHMLKLKEIAIETGIKVPIYTATAWSGELSEKEFLPLGGTYPDAPWEQNLKPIVNGDRYKLVPQYIDDVIGNDSLDTLDDVLKFKVFSQTPLGTCELGAGVQATHHRRPIISSMDAYALAFAQVAKGMNILGYYIYHGGRNPNFAPLQETRKTFYPNNLPILSYDFQAPIGEYGYPKEKYFYLRLLHYFVLHFDKKFGEKQPIFAESKYDDSSFSSSVRVDKSGSGYHYITTYERHNKGYGCEDFVAKVKHSIGEISLPSITLSDGNCFFYPFNIAIGGIKFEYITAQPLLRYKDKDGEHYVFIKHEDIKVKFKADAKVGEYGNEGELKSTDGEVVKIVCDGVNHVIEIYSLKKALDLYFDGEIAIFSSDYIYKGQKDYTKIIQEKMSNKGINLRELTDKKMKYDKYFYGKCSTSLYELKVDMSLIKACDDIKIEFMTACDAAHIYVGDKIVGDYVNIDNNFTICLSRYKKYLMEGSPIIIKTNAKKPHQRTYYEIETKDNDSKLAVKCVYKIDKKTVSIKA